MAAPLNAAGGLRPVVKDIDKVNILLIDDQPAKLLSYEVILAELGENLIKANSPQEALGLLLKTENVAVVLIDVVMPGIDGFQLAAMIREHPRFQQLAIIFVSAVQVGETDHLRGYEIGAVDYVSVPVVPKVLRAKVRVFVDLYRKTRQLEALNTELEERVDGAHRRARGADRTPAPERGAPLDRALGRRHGLVGGRCRERPHRMGRRPLPHLRRRSGDLPADRRRASRR